MKQKHSLLTALTLLAVLVTSCATPTPAPPTATTPPQPTATTAAIAPVEATPTQVPAQVSQYNEAPMLADLVKAGSLPPVDERLPDEPLVTEPLESVGKYGNTMQLASFYSGIGPALLFISEPPIKWKPDLTGFEAGVVQSYEWSSDGKTFTLHLRKGMKWSDGEPYTSADWQFWWEDLALNEDYESVSAPGWMLKSDGSPVDMEFPDEYTVSWTSDTPQWVAPYNISQGFWVFAGSMMKPAHYLKQFHPKYTSGATYDDLQKKDSWTQNPEFPCLFTWCLAERSADGNFVKFERNAYYWRVDTDGNQLPYIDYVEVEVVTDEQVRLLNCAQGKYDIDFLDCGNPLDIPFLKEKAQSGDYRLLNGWSTGMATWPAYLINQWYTEGGKNYPDDTPEKAAEIRDLLRDKRFRKALSIGFDRQRLIDVIWGGFGTPMQAGLSPQAWHYASPEGQDILKQWQQADIGFDPEQANAYLDEIGFVDKNGDGWRDLPSGKDFELVIDFHDWGGSAKIQADSAAEMENQWETNLKMQVRPNNMLGSPDLQTRRTSGQLMVLGGAIAGIDEWTFPGATFGIWGDWHFALESQWYTSGGQQGVEPLPGSPAEKLQALYTQGLAEPDLDRRHELIWEAIKINIEEGPFVIGTVGDQPAPAILKNYMRNVLDYGVTGPWAPNEPNNQVPAQWWIDK